MPGETIDRCIWKFHEFCEFEQDILLKKKMMTRDTQERICECVIHVCSIGVMVRGYNDMITTSDQCGMFTVVVLWFNYVYVAARVI